MKPRVQRSDDWIWYCPWVQCPAQVHETFGFSEVWEIALLAANDHSRDFHHGHGYHIADAVPRDLPSYKVTFDWGCP